MKFQTLAILDRAEGPRRGEGVLNEFVTITCSLRNKYKKKKKNKNSNCT